MLDLKTPEIMAQVSRATAAGFEHKARMLCASHKAKGVVWVLEGRTM